MSVSRVEAPLWATDEAQDLARQMAHAGVGAFCGPAAVAWICAVWHQHHGRPYDMLGRLGNKRILGDGPRNFFGRAPPGLRSTLLPRKLRWQSGLDPILRRESGGQLKLDRRKLAHQVECYNAIKRTRMPLMLRVSGPGGILNGLHYVVVFCVEVDRTKRRIRMHFIDNGVYCRRNESPWRVIRTPYKSYRDNVLDVQSLITEARSVRAC